MRWPLPTTLVLALAACGGDGGGAGGSTAAVDTVNGVQRWTYAAEPAPELGWTLDTVAVLGDAFASDEYQFDGVTRYGLAGDAEGALYLLDPQGSRVLAYGPDLGHRATYGRKGGGPGELSRPQGITLGPGDSIWVTDFSNSRVTAYPPDGGDPLTAAYVEGGGFPSSRLAVLEDGFIQSFRPMFGPEREGEAERTLSLLRLDRALRPVDTLWTLPEPPLDVVQLDIGQRRMMLLLAREFAPSFEWHALSDGTVVVSDTAAYHLRLIAPDGTLRRVIRRDPPPRAVTDADRELARERLRAEEEGGPRARFGGGGPDEGTRQKILEERLAKMTFADVVPRIVALRVDPRDRIWVGVSEEVPDSVARIDIYAPDGRLLGELRDFPVPDVFIGSDRIGLLRRDELDVQQVVVLRLREGEASLAGGG